MAVMAKVENDKAMKEKFSLGKVSMYLGDCMDFMRDIPDKYYDLAIVDPPYGLNITKPSGRLAKYNTNDLTWDTGVPGDAYFKELFRVSKNQIIWGGNYFDLPPTKCFIFWFMHQPAPSFADGELAWTSFNKVARCFDYAYYGTFNCDTIRIHPTQKPVALYNWLLRNYAKKTDKILDTHMGSCSSGIAAYYFGCEFDAVELDEEMFQKAVKRVKVETKQMKLFE